MSANSFPQKNHVAVLLLVAAALAVSWQAQALPTITSTVPAIGATGVSTNTTVKFTFSEAMDTATISAFFYDTSFTFYNPTPAWSAGDTVLTYTPVSAFAANKAITWMISGQNPNGDQLGGVTTGNFTTGTGGGGGNGTNAITGFILSKTHSYLQTSTNLPTIDPTEPYLFGAITSLSSNRTATNVLLTLPTSGISNLWQNPFAPELFILSEASTNLSAFESTFPSGNYTFTVKAVTSNQTVVVNFPPAMLQPGAPHLTNYNAVQSVNATQPFVLAWDAFPGGGAADFISVDIGNVFSSTNIGSPGALNGTATTLTIPANRLSASSNYYGSIGFYRAVFTTNGSSYVTTVYRATTTDFTLVTTAGSGTGPLVLTNAVWTPANFSFSVLCSTGQTVTVEYRTNLSAGQWQTLLTTNTLANNRFRAVAPQSTTNKFLFFRARNGT